MRSKQGNPFKLRQLALATALAAVSAQAVALISADGKFDATEGYQLGVSFGILDDHGTTHSGMLYFGKDANGQYLYIQMPQGYVDNTYGSNAASSWFPPLSSANGHSFNDLLSGDSQIISWGGANADQNKVKIDYLADCGTAGNPNCSVSGYLSSGVGTAGTGGAGTSGWQSRSEDSGSVLAGSASAIKNIATSLEYNLNNGFASATTNSSTNSAWIKDVGYEIQFAAGTFNDSDWLNKNKAPGLITLGDPGVSPSKKAFRDYTTPTCVVGCVQVPEPGTNWLLAAGALALLWYARRRRDNRAPATLGRLFPT